MELIRIRKDVDLDILLQFGFKKTTIRKEVVYRYDPMYPKDCDFPKIKVIAWNRFLYADVCLTTTKEMPWIIIDLYEANLLEKAN